MFIEPYVFQQPNNKSMGATAHSVLARTGDNYKARPFGESVMSGIDTGAPEPRKRIHRDHTQQELQAAADPDALISIKAVAQLVGYAKSTIRRWVREGTFPAPEHVRGTRSVRWRAGIVREWLKAHTDPLAP